MDVLQGKACRRDSIAAAHMLQAYRSKGALYMMQEGCGGAQCCSETACTLSVRIIPQVITAAGLRGSRCSKLCSVPCCYPIQCKRTHIISSSVQASNSLSIEVPLLPSHTAQLNQRRMPILLRAAAPPAPAPQSLASAPPALHHCHPEPHACRVSASCSCTSR